MQASKIVPGKPYAVRRGDTLYRCARYRSVGEFYYTADFSEASSNIMVSFFPDDDVWEPVPFQVADCRHSRREAERKIARYFK